MLFIVTDGSKCIIIYLMKRGLDIYLTFMSISEKMSEKIQYVNYHNMTEPIRIKENGFIVLGINNFGVCLLH